MRFDRPLVVCLALSAATFPGSSLAAAPEPLPPTGSVPLAPAPHAPTEELPFDTLLLLSNEVASVRYPPETLDRAARIQARLESLAELWSGFVHGRLTWNAVILRQPEWKRAGLGVWGAPQRIGPRTFALPAEGDDGTVAYARALLGGALPQLPGEPLRGTRDEAASLIVCDQLLLVEAARELVTEAPLYGDAPWVTGVLMQLAVRYAWERGEPGQTLAYVGIFDAVALAHGGARAHPLAGYGTALPYETELWYQSQFVRGADAIWVEEGWSGTKRRLYQWGRKGKPVEAAYLEKKYPSMIVWQATSFAP